MEYYEMGPTFFNKWIYQNGGKTDDIEWIDSMEGCLLDNHFISCKNGLALIKEHYLTCWSSNYILYFARFNDTKKIDQLYDIWDEITVDREE